MNPVTDLSQLHEGDRVLLPLNMLVRSSLNHRSTKHKHPEQDAELRASLKVHGVIENLSGYVDGEQFAITAGGRRLAQLQWLAKQADIPEDFAVPCFVHGIEDSTDISLTENIQRLPPHPADVFEAFAALEKQGLSAQAIGNRYGRTEAEVLRFLRLGNVHPTLFKHFRNGAMEYDQIRAYAITADRKEQLRVFKALGSDPGVMAWRIRELFRQSRLGADSKLVKFVTLKAYRKAGGRTEVDLFSENEQLLDVEILDALCEAKIERQRARLEKEGWKWVEVILDGHLDWQLQRLTPTSQGVPEDELTPISAREDVLKQLRQQHEDDWDNEALEQQIDELEKELRQMKDALESRYPPAYSDEQKAHAGVQAFVNSHGRFDIHRGLMRASDARALAQKEASGSEPDGTEGGAELSPISQSLQADLRIYRNQSLQATLVNDPAAARDLIDYQLCLATFLPCSWSRTLNLRVEANIADTSQHDLAESPVLATMEAARDALSLAWVEADTDRERFEEFRALGKRERAALLAYVAAATLIDGTDGNEDKAITLFAVESGWTVRHHWTPTGKNYFSRLKRDRLIALGCEWYGESFADDNASTAKKALVERFDALFNGDVDRLDENERSIREEWVPREMG